MDRRPRLPVSGAGYPVAPSALPPYISQHHNQRSSSSNESIMTQIPLSYHLPDPYNQGSGGFFVTPELPAQGTFENFNGGRSMSNSTSLNPNSAPYVPPGSHSQSVSGYPPHPPYDPRDSYSLPPPGTMMSASQGQHQYMDNPYYGQQASYGPVDVAHSVDQSGLFQHQIGGLPVAPLQGPFGPYAGCNEYRPSPGYPQVTQYAQHGVGSPAMSYASATTQGWNNLSYAPAHQGHAGQHQMPYGQAQAMQGQGWNGQYAEQLHEHPYMLPANANRGKPAVKYPQTSSYAGSNRASSNGSGVMKMNKKQNGGQHKVHNGGVSKQQQYGGPVMPPASMKASGSLSPKSKPASQASSSFDFQSHPSSQLVSQSASVTSDSYFDMGSPTPGPRHRKVVEFASEAKGAKTPTLRSRRGQSIQPSFTDPARKTTVDWLSKVHASGPPPKMMNLLTDAISTHEATKLSYINEDPFITTPQSAPPRRNAAPLFNNPFANQQLALVGSHNHMSHALRVLTDNGRIMPSVEVGTDPINIPFVEYCRIDKLDVTTEFGVIKLKNIPYGVNRAEVLAFLGRNARLISEAEYEPIHIVMERVTSKTLDCYVEFVNLNEAVAAVNRFEGNRSTGRNGRLGQRHIEMELSSQDALMKDLFPKAKNVVWKKGRAQVLPTDPNDRYNSGFQGFISKEEIVMLVKHVEAPQRSPFSKECPQRPFECLISTLIKYPWYMVDYITIEDRELLFDATVKLLDLLGDQIEGKEPHQQDLNVNQMLYKRLWRAALQCQGFTPSMKDTIAFKNGVDSFTAQEFGVPLFAADWKWMWALGPKPNTPHDLILWYAGRIRETLDAQKEKLSLAEKSIKGEGVISRDPKLFGDLEKVIAHPKKFKDVFQHMTLAQVAAEEWAGVESVLRQAFTPAIEGGS